MESQLLIQSESTISSHVSSHLSSHATQYTESHQNGVATNGVKRKKSSKKNKDENNISVSRSSSKLARKLRNEDEVNPSCASCAKPVYAMERIKAEKKNFHKECFRCSECLKQLTVETYQSNQTNLYCKQHFKSLFAPRIVDDEPQEEKTPKKHQLIICESSPVELPPDVVRASDKPDLGLEELSNLDVRARFQLFEQAGRTEPPPPPKQAAKRDRSAALLSRLAKFKAKGMDIGVSDEYLNGIPIEQSSSEGEDEADEDSVLKKSYKHSSTREQPVYSCNMNEIVGRFESGDRDSNERRLERKQEIQNIRSRLFMGKQAKIKEMYEQSVKESETPITSAEKIARDMEVDSEKARLIKQKFENGEAYQEERRMPKDNEDETLFNEGIGKKSRSIFLEMDAIAATAGPVSPTTPTEVPRRKEKPFIPKDIVRSADKVDDVHIETSDITNKFKFFETYKPKEERKEFRMTPPREAPQRKSPSPELYRDPNLVRSEEPVGAELSVAQQRQTAARMIDVFRQLESKTEQPAGPKPLKAFTPPPPGVERARSSSPEYSDDDSEDERRKLVAEARQRDEALQQARSLARARSFRDRFENWETEAQAQRSPSDVVFERTDEDDQSQTETAKSLREKFENMKTTSSSSVVKTLTPRVNRFV